MEVKLHQVSKLSESVVLNYCYLVFRQIQMCQGLKVLEDVRDLGELIFLDVTLQKFGQTSHLNRECD